MWDLILGTAGHIDHGKTALVRALTGVDTDRLPEEKRRGITIELGFAELIIDDVRLGIVDVPGHERFVRQMLAGATGMDLAMLVVAADDSVKPQTREHMDVLRMLDLQAGVIVLTKCDLATTDWMDLVEQEIRELALGSFLETAPIIRTSATTGQGIGELKSVLHGLAWKAKARATANFDQVPFRMAIDRSFSLAGHGTIVTGSVASGRLRVGDPVEIHPERIASRVRSLHNHDRAVEEVHRGQRAAVNLAGIGLEQLTRGFELAAPGYLTDSRWLTVQLHLLPSESRQLRDRARVRLHLGTAELPARVKLLEGPVLAPGDSGFAQLYTPPVACTWNQPLIIREESPSRTIGGGRVLVPVATRIRRFDPTVATHLRQLATGDEHARIASAIFFGPSLNWRPADLPRVAGCDAREGALAQLIQRGEIVELRETAGEPIRVHHEVLQNWQQRLLSRLGLLHDRDPLRLFFELSRVTRGLDFLAPASVLVAALRLLGSKGNVRWQGSLVGLADRQPRLSAMQQRLLQELVQRYATAGLQPPLLNELQREIAKPIRDVEQLLTVAEGQLLLVRIAKDFYLHADAELQLRTRVRDAFRQKSVLTVSEIREALASSRKYAVPFCEYLDRIQFTVRNGDQRTLVAPSSETPEP